MPLLSPQSRPLPLCYPTTYTKNYAHRKGSPAHPEVIITIRYLEAVHENFFRRRREHKAHHPSDAALLTKDAEAYRNDINYPGAKARNRLEPVYLVHDYPEGFWVHLCTDDPAAFDDEEMQSTVAGYSTHLRRLLRHLSERGIEWVRLDADGSELEGFEEQEW